MTDYPTEDRLMEEIQAEAAEIRLICGHTDTFGAEAWSKAQLMRMLSDVQWHVEKIITHTGISDLEGFYEKILLEQAHRGSAVSNTYRPYSDEEA